MKDVDLVNEARAGRAAAYAELVRRWAPRITAICHAKVGRAGMAEDLAQETLLRGYRGLGSLEDPEKFGPWLAGIARRACLDWLKARERSQVNFSEIAGDGIVEDRLGGGGDPVPELEREDEARRVLREVEGLEEEHREVLMLRYYEDRDYAEMARLLNVSAATVNARLTKARAVLRRRLERASR